MIVENESMTLDVDVEMTREYYKNRKCLPGVELENFSLQVEEVAPKLKEYMEAFGVDLTKPDELCWCWKDEKERVHYNVAYTIVGKIEKAKKYEIVLEDKSKLHLVLEDKYIPNEQKESYFGFTVYNIVMSWDVDADYPCEYEKEEEKTIFEEISKKIKKYWTKIKK